MVEEKRNGHVRRKVRSKGGKPIDENTSGLHAGEEVEEIELSDDDEAALDAAWSSMTVKEQFDEDKHPRDDDGKFTSKGGEGVEKFSNPDEVKDYVKTNGKEITKEQALEMVKGKTEKEGGVDPSIHFSSNATSHTYYEIDLPVGMLADNQNGDLYDSTTKPDIASSYASRDAKNAPPIIASIARKGGKMFVVDGGHRVSAARMRGDKTIKAIVPVRKQ